MKYFALFIFLLASTEIRADDPQSANCPNPDSIRFEELYKAYSPDGFVVTEGAKQWKASNVKEFESKLDPVITKYLKTVETWQKQGNFFQKSGKKLALAPVWAIAPKKDESPTQTFAPHLKGLMDIGLIVPQIEYKGKTNDECVYDIDAVIQIKPLNVRVNFNEIPEAKFKEING